MEIRPCPDLPSGICSRGSLRRIPLPGRSTIILQVQREIFRNGRCRCEKLQCRRPQITPHSAGRYVTSRPARYQRSRRDGCAYYPSPSRLAPAAPSERGRLFVRGKRAAMSGVSAAHPRGHASSPNPRAQPTQTRTGGKAAAAAPGRSNASTRDTRQAPGRNPRAQPTQTRTGGIAAAAAPGRISEPTRDYGPKRPHPAGQFRPRKTKGPNNPHPAAASRVSGSNCGRRCSITYPA